MAPVRPPCAIRTAPVAVCAVRGAGINTSFFLHMCVAVASVWPHGRRMIPVRPPCGYLGSALVIVKNLRPPQGRPKATVRCHFKGRTAAAGFLSPQIQNTPCGYPIYVTATVCDRGNAAAALYLLLALAILDPTAAAENVT